MTSVARILSLFDALNYIEKNEVPGDIVECGVWRGGNVRGIAEFLLNSSSRRHVWAFDTFEGMPPPQDVDRDPNNVPALVHMEADTSQTGVVWAIASIQEVRRNVLEIGLPEDRIHFVKGKVEDTLPAEGLEQIALLRLDTDWYRSTKHELETLYPRLRSGGILIIDDYGAWAGSKKATDEYFAGKRIFFKRIDSTAVIAVKP